MERLTLGFDLAFAGMSIVFSALVMVSLFITFLPRILAVVNRYIPEIHAHRQREETPAAIAAAIAAALHARRQSD